MHFLSCIGHVLFIDNQNDDFEFFGFSLCIVWEKAVKLLKFSKEESVSLITFALEED